MVFRNSLAKAATAAVLLAVAGGVVLPVGSAAAAPRSVDGVWQMDGYGTVVSIEQGHLQEYQTTAISCLTGDTAERSSEGAGSARFTADGDVYTVRLTGREGRALMHIDGSAGDRMLHRIPALPDSCSRPVAHDPVATFDVFWQTFEENYPFFAAKGVDWHAVRDRYRPRVSTGTTDAELFAVLSEMVEPLGDAHVSIFGGATGRFGQSRPGTVIPLPALDDRVKAYIADRDLAPAVLQEFANKRIGFAELPGGQGYLRVSGFGGYTGHQDDNSYGSNSAVLEGALDQILTSDRVAHLRGLIIDVRINGGGSDALALQIASRLTDRSYLAYSKVTRNDPTDPARFTRPQPVHVHVQPAAKTPRYTGPVAVLIGGSTFSAGETFTQALMGRPGGAALIGENTQGVFSDVLIRALPNGWEIGLPNEEFRTRSGQTYDRTGIPPQYREPVFTDEEFTQRRDSAFDRAVALLTH